MDVINLTHIMREIRLFAPKSIRSALIVLAEEFERLLGVEACVLDIHSERTVYVTNWIEGLNRTVLSRILKLPEKKKYLWVTIRGSEQSSQDQAQHIRLSALRVPLFHMNERFGVLSLLTKGDEQFDRETRRYVPFLSEFLSSLFLSLTGIETCRHDQLQEKSLKEELLESIGNERKMRKFLLEMLGLTKAEFCAFYTNTEEERHYIMLDGRELSPLVPHIREKLKAVYRMFTNERQAGRILKEKIYYRRQESNITIPFRNQKIESYFIVPVIVNAIVSGVLYLGSVRRDAFGKDDISRFHRLADEVEERVPVVFRLGDETDVVERLLDAIPYGGALVSPEGTIVSENKAFEEVLQTRGVLPENVYDVAKVSPFNLHGVWEEFRVLQRDLIDRELKGSGLSERTLAVTWIKLESLSEEVNSLVLLKDITLEKEQEAIREEMLATVAHELRTPLTALKNSLKIIIEESSTNHGEHDLTHSLPAGRFLKTAVRNIDRLVMLVSGLTDVSAQKIVDRPLNPAPVHVKSFLEEASVFFLESMRKKEIQFHISVDERVAKLVFDVDRMEQVIQNLISNSIKSVPAGGRISLSASPSSGSIEQALPVIPWKFVPVPEFADICVHDSGSGVSSEVVNSINPSAVNRDDHRRTTRGLGLYIAKRLMQLHGGSLLIDKGEEVGSKVHLYLPIDPELGQIVRQVRLIEQVLEDMIRRGLTPTLFIMVKENFRCWLEIAGTWDSIPVVNPGRDEITDTGVFLWPLGKNLAITLTAADRFAGSPLSIIRRGRGGLRPISGDVNDSIRIGWAVGNRDGMSYMELLTVSLRRVEEQPIVTVRKGEIE